MNKKYQFSISHIVLLAFLFSCGTPAEKTVMIGDQAWMVKNLDVITFRNGDTIPEAKSNEEWIKSGQGGLPAWCYYYNEPENGKKYGKLYNWYAVNDPRGLAPVGWHVPGNEEWSLLSNILLDDAGSKMKSKSGWEDNGNGNNESGFSGLPGGWRDVSGEFKYLGYIGAWWSSNEIDAQNATYWDLTENSSKLFTSNISKAEGHYVRCLSGDKESMGGENVNDGSIVSADENLKKESVKIGNQVWIAENLHVSTFRNGDPIPEAKTAEEWANASKEGTPAWCYYGNHSNLEEWYGKLYNWYAVNDPKDLAPEGWRIPTAVEWDQMIGVVGDDAVAKLKSTGGWDDDQNGTNESGFNGMPGGFRYADSRDFILFGIYGVWWTATESIDNEAEARHIANFNSEMLWLPEPPDWIGRFSADKGYGFSVRCIATGTNATDAGAGDNSNKPGQSSIDTEASTTLEMLQGKWQHTEDTSNYLVFEKYFKKEIAGGLTEWTVEEFVLSDKCMNETDKDRFPGGGDEIFITSIQNDMCWGISELSETTLSLIYVGGRGNINTYRKVE